LSGQPADGLPPGAWACWGRPLEGDEEPADSTTIHPLEEERMLTYIRTLLAYKKGQDGGASAVEYGLLIAAIAAVIVVVVFTLGKVVQRGFQNTCDKINGNGAVSTCTNN
jgi:pilus assembly protein Flp/PilA